MDKKRYDFMLGTTTDEDLENLEKLIDQGFCITDAVYNEMSQDDEDDSGIILRMYQSATKKERAIMDALLVCLCGWSLENIVTRNADAQLQSIAAEKVVTDDTIVMP